MSHTDATATEENMAYSPVIPWLLALGISIVLVSTDIYVPSMPAMMIEFGATELDLQWTLSLNSFGYCIASPFVGPISDAIGRKNVLIVSVLFFILASIACGMAPNLIYFDVARFLQGASSAALPIVSLAAIADIMKGRKFAAMMAYIGIVITLSFALGPLIGGVVAEHYGWRVLFYGCAGGGVFIAFSYWLLLPETLKKIEKISPKKIIKTYGAMFKDPLFLLYGMIGSFMLTGFFAYITSSSYLYINEFGLSRPEFGVITSLGMVSNAMAHLVVGRLMATFGERKVLRVGIALVVTSTVIMAWMTFIDVKSAYTLLIPVLIYNLALGFTFPPALALAIGQFQHAAGTASAFLGTFRMVLLGFGSYLGGHNYDGTLVSISSLMIFFASMVVVSYLWVSAIRAKEDQRQVA